MQKYHLDSYGFRKQQLSAGDSEICQPLQKKKDKSNVQTDIYPHSAASGTVSGEFFHPGSHTGISPASARLAFLGPAMLRI